MDGGRELGVEAGAQFEKKFTKNYPQKARPY